MVPRSMELSTTMVPVNVPLVHDPPSEEPEGVSALPQSHMMLLKASCCASPGEYHDPVSHMMANKCGSKPAVAPSPSTWKDGSCSTWYPASPSSALTGSLPTLFAPSSLRHLDGTQAKLHTRSDGLLPDGSRAASGVLSSAIVVSSSTSSNTSCRHSDHGFGGEGGLVDATELWSGTDTEIQSAGACGEELPVANAPDIRVQDDTANIAKSQAEAAVAGSVEPPGLRADCGSTLSGSSSDLLNDAARCELEGCGGDTKEGSTGEAARPSHVLEMLSAAVQQQEFVVVGGDDARHTTDCAPATVHVGSNHHVPQPAARLQSSGSHAMVLLQKRQCNPPPLPAMGLKLADIKRVIGLKTAPPTKKPRKGESVSPSSAAAHHAAGTSSLAHRLAAVLPAHAQHHSAKLPFPPSSATLSDMPTAPHAAPCSPCVDAPSALARAPGASLPCRGGETLDDVARQMHSWPGRAMNCASPAGDACGGLNCSADCNGHMAKAHGPLPCARSPDGAAEPVCAGCVGLPRGLAQGDAMLMCPGCTPSNAMAPGSDGPWPTAAGHYHASSHQHADMLCGAAPPYSARFPMGMSMGMGMLSSSVGMGMDALGNPMCMEQHMPMGMGMEQHMGMGMNMGMSGSMGMGMDALGNPMMLPWQQHALPMECSCCPPSALAGAPWEASLSPSSTPAPLSSSSLHPTMCLPSGMPGTGTDPSGTPEASASAPGAMTSGLEARLAGALAAEAAGSAGMAGVVGPKDGQNAAGLWCSADGLAEAGVGGAMGAASEKVEEDRDIKRKESNRVSARKSRQRRQLQMDRLEAEAVQLRDTNTALSQQAQEAETCVEELIGQQRELQRQCEAVRKQLKAVTYCSEEDALDIGPRRI
ncbi:unnamed protein product [Closterium sp. NIES-53]